MHFVTVLMRHLALSPTDISYASAAGIASSPATSYLFTDEAFEYSLPFELDHSPHALKLPGGEWAYFTRPAPQRAARAKLEPLQAILAMSLS